MSASSSSPSGLGVLAPSGNARPTSSPLAATAASSQGCADAVKERLVSILYPSRDPLSLSQLYALCIDDKSSTSLTDFHSFVEMHCSDEVFVVPHGSGGGNENQEPSFCLRSPEVRRMWKKAQGSTKGGATAEPTASLHGGHMDICAFHVFLLRLTMSSRSGACKDTLRWTDIKIQYRKATERQLSNEELNAICGTVNLTRKELLQEVLAGIVEAVDPGCYILRPRLDYTKGAQHVNLAIFSALNTDVAAKKTRKKKREQRPSQQTSATPSPASSSSATSPADSSSSSSPSTTTTGTHSPASYSDATSYQTAPSARVTPLSGESGQSRVQNDEFFSATTSPSAGDKELPEEFVMMTPTTQSFEKKDETADMEQHHRTPTSCPPPQEQSMPHPDEQKELPEEFVMMTPTTQSFEKKDETADMEQHHRTPTSCPPPQEQSMPHPDEQKPDDESKDGAGEDAEEKYTEDAAQGDTTSLPPPQLPQVILTSGDSEEPALANDAYDGKFSMGEESETVDEYEEQDAQLYSSESANVTLSDENVVTVIERVPEKEETEEGGEGAEKQSEEREQAEVQSEEEEELEQAMITVLEKKVSEEKYGEEEEEGQMDKQLSAEEERLPEIAKEEEEDGGVAETEDTIQNTWDSPQKFARQETIRVGREEEAESDEQKVEEGKKEEEKEAEEKECHTDLQFASGDAAAAAVMESISVSSGNGIGKEENLTATASVSATFPESPALRQKKEMSVDLEEVEEEEEEGATAIVKEPIAVVTVRMSQSSAEIRGIWKSVEEEAMAIDAENKQLPPSFVKNEILMEAALPEATSPTNANGEGRVGGGDPPNQALRREIHRRRRVFPCCVVC